MVQPPRRPLVASVGVSGPPRGPDGDQGVWAVSEVTTKGIVSEVTRKGIEVVEIQFDMPEVGQGRKKRRMEFPLIADVYVEGNWPEWLGARFGQHIPCHASKGRPFAGPYPDLCNGDKAAEGGEGKRPQADVQGANRAGEEACPRCRGEFQGG
jgi:hypothetical protein